MKNGASVKKGNYDTPSRFDNARFVSVRELESPYGKGHADYSKAGRVEPICPKGICLTSGSMS